MSDAVSFELATATIDDAQALADFAARLFVATYAEFNTEADMRRYIGEHFDARHQRDQINDNNWLTRLLFREDTLAGYYQLRIDGTRPDCVKTQSSSELVRFYIDQQWHGQGLAQTMMADTLVQAKAKSALLWLGVWSENPRAIRFYEKAGFQNIGHAEFRLGADVQKDHVLAYTF